MTVWTAGAFCVLILSLCVYRLTVFDLRPLDAPGTLRPILYRWFHWFLSLYPKPGEAFRVWSAACRLLLLVPAVLAVLNYAVRNSPSSGFRIVRLLCSRGLFFAAIASCLSLCRFPALLENEFNPDEGQFLASAHKLFYDPNFFRAVDTGTTGPINIFPLMLPAMAGLSPDFASSRIIALTTVFLSALLLYRSIALLAPERLARIAVLPFFGTFAVFKDIELVHYSSEHVPALLIAAAIYLAVRVLHDSSKHRLEFVLLGTLSSAAFFSKIQSVPVILAIVGVALARVYAVGAAREWRRPIALLVAGAIPLMVGNAALCLAAGVWGDFWMSYIRANASYVDMKNAFPVDLREFFFFLLRSREVRVFQLALLAITLAFLVDRLIGQPGNKQATRCAFIARVRGFFSAADPVRWFGLLSLVSVAAATFAVYKAHHPFIHYLLFLFLPACVAVGWMLVRQTQIASLRPPRRAAFLAVVIGISVSFQNYLWGYQDDHVFRYAGPQIRSSEGDFIRLLTGPGDTIFVWGWTVHPYLASGRVSATRDTNVSGCFRSYNLMTWPPEHISTPGSDEVAAYYQRRILHDLSANPPKLFVDAIGPASWFLRDRNYFGLGRFPDLDAFVKENYVFLEDRNSYRYFLRRGPASRSVANVP